MSLRSTFRRMGEDLVETKTLISAEAMQESTRNLAKCNIMTRTNKIKMGISIAKSLLYSLRLHSGSNLLNTNLKTFRSRQAIPKLEAMDQSKQLIYETIIRPIVD